MADNEFTIDHEGARGSNSGDDYHELWAVRHALRLLDDRSQLCALTVEGLRAEDGTGSVWDGVDCALFYGGDNSSDAVCVELQQLKYSAAAPTSPWTVARLSTGRNGRATNSPIRRLADAYKKIVEVRSSKPLDSVKVALVTNQPVDADVLAALGQASEPMPASYRRAWRAGLPDLHRLIHASGLTLAEFKNFAQAIDLQGNAGSRFLIEEAVLKAVAEWNDVEFRDSALWLREYLRSRMVPESAGDVITREKVLLRLGASDERALFPCPLALKPAANPIPRAVAGELVDRMLAGRQRLCMHGGAGVGKTTILFEIAERLPTGSVVVMFDCYGGGSYRDASALRHRSQDAFLQLSNDLARQLRVPLSLPPRAGRNHALAFHKRLVQAAALLESTAPGALLLLAVDAADNSVTAATQCSPPERSFVHELMSFTELPRNVRLLVSGRTGRLGELDLPRSFEKVPLLAFKSRDTEANVARYWAAPADWIEDFHHLSNGVPRVQAYAFDNAGETPQSAIDSLHPLGKKLEDVFKDRFQEALIKTGRPDDLQLVCAGLVALSRPIPIGELAAVLGFSEAQVADVCADLAPGVRNEGGFLSFADEDFEAFVRQEAENVLDDVRQRTAVRLLSRASTDEYAAFNVVPALFEASRASDLLELVELNPEPSPEVVRDPVRRREVRIQRLLTAIRVCREAGDAARALRFVLIGAEAIRTATATRQLLASNPELTARYAKETARRLILGDSDLIEEHGALIMQLLAQDSANGDAVALRNGRRRLQAWGEARQDSFEREKQKYSHARAWELTDTDGAAILYATLLHEGPEAAISRLKQFRPRQFAYGSGRALIERLLAERRFERAAALAAVAPDSWAVFVLVPLAMALQPIDHQRLERGLQVLKRSGVFEVATLDRSTATTAFGSYVIDTLLAATEILSARGVSADTLQSCLAPFLSPEVRRVDRRHDFESEHLDAILRAYCLAEALTDCEAKSSDVLTPRPAPAADAKSEREPRTSVREHDESVLRLVGGVAGFYIARAKAVADARNGRAPRLDFSAAQNCAERDMWHFDRRGAIGMRARIADGLTVLLAVGVEPSTVLSEALDVRTGVWPDGDNGIARLAARCSAVPQLHERLLAVIASAAREVRRERSGAEGKSQALAAYARLLIPVSSDDADVLFKMAIEVAAELDSDAMDQLRFAARLIERARPALTSDLKSAAGAFAEVIRDAGIRLQGNEHFPWAESFRGLARMDFPSALAAAARWQDTSIVSLELSLPPVTSVGVDAGEITIAQSLAILGLLSRPSAAQFGTVMTDGPNASAVAEELARDLLTDRIAGSNEMEAFISRNGTGAWATHCREQQAFESRLPRTQSASDATTGTNRRLAFLSSCVWQDDVLTDGERLGETANQLLKQSRDAGEYLSLEDVLTHARSAVPVGLRIAHLKALQSLVRTSSDASLRVVLGAVENWSGQPAVVEWSETWLPELITAALPALARYLPWDDKDLQNALKLTRANEERVQTVLLDGIERNTDQIGAPATYCLAGEIALRLPVEKAGALCNWYIDRLRARISPEDLEGINPATIPQKPEDAVARLFVALMSDVDLRQRWRAAHCLRRLARLGELSTFAKAIAENDRREEPAFRDPSAPFYWVAMKLWLFIALDRVATESPTTAAAHRDVVFAGALSETFPHLLIRDYAADAIRALLRSGQIELSAEQIGELANVNRSALPRGKKKRSYGRSFDRSTPRGPARRFAFNVVDTLPYWYEPWLRVFEDLKPDEFLKSAERWIVDAWRAVADGDTRPSEPRSARFNEHDWALSSADHGSIPTIEHYTSYLEWHAMWCTAGEMLRRHPVAGPDYEGADHVEERIGWNKLSMSGLWAADLVGPRPLEIERWLPPADGREWFEQVSEARFHSELAPSSRPGFIVVDSYIEERWGRRRESTHVRTALVSRETGHALLRALQTIDDSSDYYLCPEGHDQEIDDPGYTLRGWLKHDLRDSRFDGTDVYSNEVRGVECAPGTLVTKSLRLERQLAEGCMRWKRPDDPEPVFIYEAWGRRKRDRRHDGDDDGGARGHRLLMRSDQLTKWLSSDRFDLIAEVGVSRRDQKQRGYAADEEEETEATFDRVFLLRADGRIETAERSAGTWRADRSGVGT